MAVPGSAAWVTIFSRLERRGALIGANLKRAAGFSLRSACHRPAPYVKRACVLAPKGAPLVAALFPSGVLYPFGKVHAVREPGDHKGRTYIQRFACTSGLASRNGSPFS